MARRRRACGDRRPRQCVATPRNSARRWPPRQCASPCDVDGEVRRRCRSPPPGRSLAPWTRAHRRTGTGPNRELRRHCVRPSAWTWRRIHGPRQVDQGTRKPRSLFKVSGEGRRRALAGVFRHSGQLPAMSQQCVRRPYVAPFSLVSQRPQDDRQPRHHGSSDRRHCRPESVRISQSIVSPGRLEPVSASQRRYRFVFPL